MLNSELLGSCIESSGLKKQFIAKKLGLTPYGLQKKINGITEFKASEIFKLCDILNIQEGNKRDSIFFAHEGDL